jgi:hypothetical protein
MLPGVRNLPGQGSEGTRHVSWEPALGGNSTWEGQTQSEDSSLAQHYSAARDICSLQNDHLELGFEQPQDFGAEEAA